VRYDPHASTSPLLRGELALSKVVDDDMWMTSLLAPGLHAALGVEKADFQRNNSKITFIAEYFFRSSL
jgi:hypothetical protein